MGTSPPIYCVSIYCIYVWCKKYINIYVCTTCVKYYYDVIVPNEHVCVLNIFSIVDQK